MRPPNAIPAEDELDLGAESLADVGWSAVARALNDVEADDIDADVLVRLLSLADDLAIGSRFDAVEFRTDDRRVATLNLEKRNTLRLVLARRRDAPAATPTVAGVLFEADFERRTAKVRSQDGRVVDLLFEEDQSDAIQEALRERSQFQGDVTFDPITASIKSIKLRRITRYEQLLLGEDGGQAFWRRVTADDLINEQGAHPITSFEDLRDASISDDEFDQFIATLS